jgi:hypothetical protein
MAARSKPLTVVSRSTPARNVLSPRYMHWKTYRRLDPLDNMPTRRWSIGIAARLKRTDAVLRNLRNSARRARAGKSITLAETGESAHVRVGEAPQRIILRSPQAPHAPCGVCFSWNAYSRRCCPFTGSSATQDSSVACVPRSSPTIPPHSAPGLSLLYHTLHDLSAVRVALVVTEVAANQILASAR